MNFKKLLTSGRIIVLILALVIALWVIKPNPWQEGVAITHITKDSAAFLGGMQTPDDGTLPRNKEVITNINNIPIKTLSDYEGATQTFFVGEDIQIKTNKGLYRVTIKEALRTITLNETEERTITETELVNQTINGTVEQVSQNITHTITVNKTTTESLGIEDLGITVEPAPTTNIRKGLDLQGGTRVLLEPADPVSDDELQLVIERLEQRLNVYGLSDLNIALVKSSPDILGGGDSFILVEIAGASQEEVRDLISSQGKFEAKIANETVFIGGQDITYVCRTATCSGIDPNVGCGPTAEGGYQCGFYFSISLTQDAANRQAALTDALSVDVTESGYRRLSEDLVLFLDDTEVDRLSIAADLKGRAVTDIAISGGGAGSSEEAAAKDTLQQMKQLQTILDTGSLPVKLDVVRIDTVSPVLGASFLQNALLTGLLAVLIVTAVLVIAFRKFILSVPIIIASISETILILGMAAIIGWNIDLAAIAGIIVAIGTGVDDQIVIADETLRGKNQRGGWKERIKRAFFIIFTAYFTTMVAMTPLLFAGAGLLKGFALTTMLGVTLGVFITRPAFAVLVEHLAKDSDE